MVKKQSVDSILHRTIEAWEKKVCMHQRWQEITKTKMLKANIFFFWEGASKFKALGNKRN